MKALFSRTLTILCAIIVVLSSITTAFAHSGRTDSNGGHRDNQNKSGLGYYHYHCGGYPAHLHSNGYCPYKSTPQSNSSNTSSNQSTASGRVDELLELAEQRAIQQDAYKYKAEAERAKAQVAEAERAKVQAEEALAEAQEEAERAKAQAEQEAKQKGTYKTVVYLLSFAIVALVCYLLKLKKAQK